MSSEILKNLILAKHRFKESLWMSDLGEISQSELFTICLTQFKKDLQDKSNGYETIKRDQTIAVYASGPSESRISYYNFKGLCENHGRMNVLKLMTGDEGNLTIIKPFPNVQNSLRLAEQLELKRLTKIDGSYGQKLASKRSPVDLLDGTLGEAVRNSFIISLENERLVLKALKRTKIVFVVGSDQAEFEDILRSAVQEDVALLDCFPGRMMHNSDLKDGRDIGSCLYQHLNLSPNFFVFARISTALEFIQSMPDQHFLVITDRYSQLYNSNVWQMICALDNYDLIHIGRMSDFKNFYNSDSLILQQHDVVPNIIVQQVPNRNLLKKQILRVTDEEIDSFIKELLESRKRTAEYHPEGAQKLTQLLSAICMLVFPSNDTVINLKELSKQAALSIRESCFNELMTNNPKKEIILQLDLEQEWNLIVPDVNSVDLSAIGNKNIQVKDWKYLLQDVAPNSKLVISYVDKWFLLSRLFPLLLLSKIKLENIYFILYQYEERALLGILSQFRKSINSFLINGTRLSGISVDANAEQSELAEDPSIVIDAIFDFNTFSKKYIVTAQHQDRFDFVDAITLGLSDGVKDYVGLLTQSYKPYVLNDNNLKREDLETIENGDVLVFIEGQGERGILDTYRDSFFINDGNDINNIKMWKDFLRNHLMTNEYCVNRPRLKDFLRGLKAKGLNRSEVDVRRWLEPDSIGTQSPRDDFEIISKVIGNPLFINNYDKLATSCIKLQSKCKSVGKVLKNLALRDFAGIDTNETLREFDQSVKDNLENIARKIKTVRVVYIDRSIITIHRHDSNILIDTTDAKTNSTLFE